MSYELYTIVYSICYGEIVTLHDLITKGQDQYISASVD